MDREFSESLRQDVSDSVRNSAARYGAIDVNAISEAVRLRHLAENVALEDIASLVMKAADWIGRPMVFEPIGQNSIGSNGHASRSG